MRKIADLLIPKEGEDGRAKTLEAVRKNITFRGGNLWILACAITIASVGLSINSTAIIIGAMLISPLMGPIVGAGFALGIYDFSLFKKSLKNLLIATMVSLVVSTLYFYLSPFKDVQSELLDKTSPNIYDILISFFGGVVGVIAITRSEKENPISGVAIATALMPPLCTAGYGIATAQWTFFLGAFYLYCINCVFIGIATFLIIKYLNYSAVKQVDEKHQKRVKYIIAFLITVMLLPSSYLAYSLYREQQIKSSENEMSLKDLKIMQMEKELTINKFDNRKILNETRVLFPIINSLSINKSTLINQRDSITTITAVIYDSTKSLDTADSKKLKKWLNERLSVKDVELFKRH